MSTLSNIADALSILGFCASLVTLWIASRVRKRVLLAQNRLVRRIRIQEIRASLTSEIRPLNQAITRNLTDNAVTIAHRVAADLEQLYKHGTPELAEVISAAQHTLDRMRQRSQEHRQALLAELRDTVAQVVKRAENLERELAWSDHEQ